MNSISFPKQEPSYQLLYDELNNCTYLRDCERHRIFQICIEYGLESVHDIDHSFSEYYKRALVDEHLSDRTIRNYMTFLTRIKIDSLPDYSISILPKDLPDDICLLYYGSKSQAQQYKKTVDKSELYVDLHKIVSETAKLQLKSVLLMILDKYPSVRERHVPMRCYNALTRYASNNNIDNLEQMEECDINQYLLYLSNEPANIKKYGKAFIEGCRRHLVSKDSEINWNCPVWYLDLLISDKMRNNPSAPVKTINMLGIYDIEARGMLQQYLRDKIVNSDISAAQIRQLFTYIRIFLKYLYDNNVLLRECDFDVLEEFELIIPTDTNETYNRWVSVLQAFFHHLYVVEYLPTDYGRNLYRKQVRVNHVYRLVPPETITAILEHLDDLSVELRIMYWVLLFTGRRKSEICTLKGNCLRMDQDVCILHLYQYKLRRSIEIPIPENLYKMIRKYISDNHIGKDEYLFKNSDGDAYNSNTFSSKMIEFCNRWGIDCGEYIFRAHDYRHNVATELSKMGLPIKTIMQYLGHNNEAMTRRYLEEINSRILKEQQKYWESHNED